MRQASHGWSLKLKQKLLAGLQPSAVQRLLLRLRLRRRLQRPGVAGVGKMGIAGGRCGERQASPGQTTRRAVAGQWNVRWERRRANRLTCIATGVCWGCEEGVVRLLDCAVLYQRALLLVLDVVLNQGLAWPLDCAVLLRKAEGRVL